MEYIVYKTTNLVNNKIYIGAHKAKGEDKFGGYYGCGVNINFPASYKNPKTLFQKAIVEYGFDNFKREILYVFNTAEEAYSKEKELVNIDFINSFPDFSPYNLIFLLTSSYSFAKKIVTKF